MCLPVYTDLLWTRNLLVLVQMQMQNIKTKEFAALTMSTYR
jgi:hypothetical protein